MMHIVSPHSIRQSVDKEQDLKKLRYVAGRLGLSVAFSNNRLQSWKERTSLREHTKEQ